MRGFITFVLAGALVLALVSMYSGARGESVALQVQKLEKKYYFEMDVKRAIAQGAREGVGEAEREFAACAAEGNCKKGLRELAQEKVGARIAALAQYLEANPEWKVMMWCGRTSEEELGEIAMGGNPAGEMCAQCKSASEWCGELVEVDFARRVVRLQGGELLLGMGEFYAVGFGAVGRDGEIPFEAYFPPWLEISY